MDGSLKLRDYQEESLQALDNALQTSEGNPCVVLPTGSGKSLVMAEAVKRWIAGYPAFRCIVLAHRKELVKQNSEEFKRNAPGIKVGVYSAGLNRRDMDKQVTFAGIDSVYKLGGTFEAFDIVIVDEAHRIPVRGEGKYRSFINMCKVVNPKVRVVGFTATPFRMSCGSICHRDHILNTVCYEANVGDLIQQGYLCKLRSKVGKEESADISEVKKNSGGDYIINSLASASRKGDLVTRAVRSAVGHLRDEKRSATVWFCVDVAHCKDVAAALISMGIPSAVVTGQTKKQERDNIVRQFKERHVHHLINCNVFTEGFNAQHIDSIILLRPTLSKGLYSQMVGRGLRTHNTKSDCLILDYAHCIYTHGPIDCLEAGEVVLYTCQQCKEVFSKATRVCPACGWEIPKETIEREAREEAQRRKHAAEAAELEILGRIPQELEVNEVFVELHKKQGSPDSLRISYRCGMQMIREWVCLEHGGYAEQKARRWWADRFGLERAKTVTVNSALQELFLPSELTRITKTITVKRNGKYFEIISHKLEH